MSTSDNTPPVECAECSEELEGGALLALCMQKHSGDIDDSSSFVPPVVSQGISSTILRSASDAHPSTLISSYTTQSSQSPPSAELPSLGSHTSKLTEIVAGTVATLAILLLCGLFFLWRSKRYHPVPPIDPYYPCSDQICSPVISSESRASVRRAEATETGFIRQGKEHRFNGETLGEINPESVQQGSSVSRLQGSLNATRNQEAPQFTVTLDINIRNLFENRESREFRNYLLGLMQSIRRRSLELFDTNPHPYRLDDDGPSLRS